MKINQCVEVPMVLCICLVLGFIPMTQSFFNNALGMAGNSINDSLGMMDSLLNDSVGTMDSLLNESLGMMDSLLNDSLGMMNNLLNDSVGMTNSYDDCLLQVFCFMSDRCVNIDGNCTQSGITCPPDEVRN